MGNENTETLGEGRFLRLVKRNGWEYVDRKNVCGLVALVPVTPEGELVLVEQYRPPVEAMVVETPAGLAGDTDEFAGESLETAASRELLEETGFEAATLAPLTAGPPSGGQSTEIISFFLAHGLKRVNGGGGDASEEITVHVVPLAEVERFLAEREAAGSMIDPKVYTGIYFARRHVNGGTG